MAKIIGREAQQKELRDLYESKNAEFVAVYGARANQPLTPCAN